MIDFPRFTKELASPMDQLIVENILNTIDDSVIGKPSVFFKDSSVFEEKTQFLFLMDIGYTRPQLNSIVTRRLKN